MLYVVLKLYYLMLRGGGKDDEPPRYPSLTVSNVPFPPFSPPWFVTKTSKIFVKEPPADMAQTNSWGALSVSCGAAVRMLASSW